MITLVMTAALLIGNYKIQIHNNEVRGYRVVYLEVRGEQVKSRARGQLRSVTLNVLAFVRPDIAQPEASIDHEGVGLWADDGDVYLLIDGEQRHHVACRLSDDRETHLCGAALVDILRTAKKSVRIQTDLADFSLPIADVQKGLAEFDKRYAAETSKAP